jgi:predicted dinucleotide-binding enzyme
MKVLVIGAGNMGSAFVKRLSAAGHSVSVKTRSTTKADALAAQYPGVKVVVSSPTNDEYDVILLATGYSEAKSALQSAGNLQGKVVVDITNPLTSDYMALTIGHSTSAAEEISRAVPEALVVKAFNTLFAQVIAEGGDFGQGTVVPTFVAGDSEHAKKVATELALSLGFTAVDAGALKNARYLEPLAGLNIYLGYGAGLGTSIAPTWITRKDI